MLDYDKGHQTGEGGESPFLLPFLFFFLLLPFLSLSFSVDRIATEENGGFEFFVFSLSLFLSLFLLSLPPSGEVIYPRINEAKKNRRDSKRS